MFNRRQSLASAAAMMALQAVGGPTKIYGYNNIKAHLQRQKPYYGRRSGSRADQYHDCAGEIARRLRQQARDRLRQQERHPMGVNCGLSRRGKLVQHT
jgi:hypothetical protein